MAAGTKPRYDGRSRELGRPARRSEQVIRFKNPPTATSCSTTRSRAASSWSNTELDDLVI